MDIEKKIWEDRIFPNFNDNLVIHFIIPKWDDELEFQISMEIFWKRNKIDVYIPETIFFSTPVKIEYTFENGIIIKGTLEIKEFSSFNNRDTLGIFGDFYYYKKKNDNYIWHTEGFLISFASRIEIIEEIEEVIVIDELVIPKKEIDIPISVNPTVASNTYNDLFPYIYVSGWPKINATEKIWNFTSYKPDAKKTTANLFYNNLVKLKTANDRLGMQKEAVSFIEGASDYKQQYVDNVYQLEEYIGGFLSFYHDLERQKDLTNIIRKTCSFFNTNVKDFSNYLKKDTFLKAKERLWGSYFALLIEIGYENEILEDIIKVVTLCNFLETIFDQLKSKQEESLIHESKLKYLFHATIILDDKIFPLPLYKSPGLEETTNVIFPYAIGNLQLVKYKLLRYEVGELASITSIMPGEKRKLVNRKLDRVVDKEVTKSITLSETQNASNDQSNDFNEELWNAIAETTETTNYPDPGLVSTYGPPTNVTIKGTFTKAQTTQTPDKKQLSSFAKKILNRTTQRLSDKINKVRAHTELKELEDTSVSFLNNSNSKESAYGIYCWLNKIYQAKVINYGNRMLFSFVIPNPAADYIKQIKILEGNNLVEPKSLLDWDVPVMTYQDITLKNYLELCQYYQLKNFPLLPQDTIVVSDVVSLSQSKLIPLPEGYCGDSANLEYAFGAGKAEAQVSGFVGQNTFTFSRSTGLIGSKAFPKLNKEQNGIAVSVVYNPSIELSPPNSELDFQMAVEITCVPLPQTILSWQINLYQLLNDAYLDQMREYNLKMNSSKDKKENINPLGQRLIVKQELEKSIRKQLLENALQVNGLPLSMINSLSRATSQYNEPEIIQYLNSVLEWNEMSYTFFDQYDNHNGKFAVSSLSPDFFSAFLKASYARVIIPVFPTFNYGFLYFLNTGAVWSAKDSLAPCFPDDDKTLSPDQLSIVYELKKIFYLLEPKPELIDAWEVLLPTSMQILQNKKFLNIKNHD